MDTFNRPIFGLVKLLTYFKVLIHNYAKNRYINKSRKILTVFIVTSLLMSSFIKCYIQCNNPNSSDKRSSILFLKLYAVDLLILIISAAPVKFKLSILLK